MKKQALIFILALLCFMVYKIYKMPRFAKGQTVTNFEAVLRDGSAFELSDLKGQYVLLDFWGSWCGPCRRESPQLVKLNETFAHKAYHHADGFTIVSVAIETNKKSWQKAIQIDKLDWKHHIVETDRFKSPIAQLYHVKEIPTKYLLDTNGNVIFVNPSFEQIRSFLAKG